MCTVLSFNMLYLLKELMANQLVQELNLVEGSKTAQTLLQLADDLILQLLEVFIPDEDYLIHVDESGFSVNHGAVGTRGIRYEFR